MATNKIIKWGLQKTVEELIAAGIRTSTKISEALKAKGYSVSQPTVSRYLASVEEERADGKLKISFPTMSAPRSRKT